MRRLPLRAGRLTPSEFSTVAEKLQTSVGFIATEHFGVFIVLPERWAKKDRVRKVVSSAELFAGVRERRAAAAAAADSEATA